MKYLFYNMEQGQESIIPTDQQTDRLTQVYKEMQDDSALLSNLGTAQKMIQEMQKDDAISSFPSNPYALLFHIVEDGGIQDEQPATIRIDALFQQSQDNFFSHEWELKEDGTLGGKIPLSEPERTAIISAARSHPQRTEHNSLLEMNAIRQMQSFQAARK